MTVIYDPLTAWTRELRELPEEHALALQKTGIVSVAPSDKRGSWLVGTDSRVGVLVGEGWQIGIRPKLTIPRLLFLLSYSFRPDGWRNTQALFEKADQIEDAVATAFAVHAQSALRPGVLHGYINVDPREYRVRGRVRFADQIARSPGVALPVEVSYDDFTANILENRMLLTAAELLRRLPRIAPLARSILLWIHATLGEVEPILDPRGIMAPEITRLNQRYAAALALAELILRSASITSEGGKVVATSFVFDMNEVFESFLTTRLTERFKQHGGWVDSQRSAKLAGKISMRTDITWHGTEGHRAVVDAKYKSLVDSSSMPNADAYQMLAYCIALGLPRGYLVYAKDAGEGRHTHRIVRHGYEIEVRAIDVELEPESLLTQVDQIADEIATAWRSEGQVAA